EEDAFAGAVLGRLDARLLEPRGHGGNALGPSGVGVDVRAVLDIRETVVEEDEDVRADLLAQAVTGAEILVDPDLHGGHFLAGGKGECGGADYASRVVVPTSTVNLPGLFRENPKGTGATSVSVEI